MKPLSMDLRERIVAAREQGESAEEVAHRFSVGVRTVWRYWRRAKDGELAPKRAPGRAPRLRPDQEAAFIAMVQEHPNWTLEQYGQEWQRLTAVFLPKSTLWDHLKRLDGHYKKRVP